MTGMLNFVFLLAFVSKIGTSIVGHVNASITDSFNTSVSQRNELWLNVCYERITSFSCFISEKCTSRMDLILRKCGTIGRRIVTGNFGSLL